MDFTFATVDVKTELVNLLKQELPKKGYGNVKVLKADPANPAEVPCVGINRVSDDEDSQTLADEQGTAYDKATKTYTIFRGTFFSEALEVRIWHTNADERGDLYQVVKAILFAFRIPLVEKGLLNVSLRGGRDEQDTTMQHAPTPIYWSTITMTYLNPLNVEIVEVVEPISGFTGAGTLSP